MSRPYVFVEDAIDAHDPLQWRALIESILEDARFFGHIITVETVPGQPLAMGNYTQRVDVRPVIDHRAEAAKRGGYDIETGVEK